MQKKFYNVEESPIKIIEYIFMGFLAVFLVLVVTATYQASKINYNTITDFKYCSVYDTEWEDSPRKTKVYAVCNKINTEGYLPGWVSEYEFNKPVEEKVISVDICNLENVDYWFRGYEVGKNQSDISKYNNGFINGAKAFVKCLDKGKGQRVCEEGLQKLEEHKGDNK